MNIVIKVTQRGQKFFVDIKNAVGEFIRVCSIKCNSVASYEFKQSKASKKLRELFESLQLTFTKLWDMLWAFVYKGFDVGEHELTTTSATAEG